MQSTCSSIYESIPERTIRLLTLHPRKENGPLKGAISNFHLPDDPQPGTLPFEALSYTWGEPTFPCNILCQLQKNQNPVRVNITQNLSDALLELCYSDRDRVLWIDIICINQRDDLEKSTQIPLMSTIFRCAKHVLIWLGLHDQSTERALAIVDVAAKHSDPSNSVFQDGRKMCTDEQLLAWGFPSREAVDWIDLTNLLNRPWFSRVWTRQEAILAFDATGFIGHRSFSWQKLDDAVCFLCFWSLIPEITPVFTLCTSRSNFQDSEDPSGHCQVWIITLPGFPERI